MRILFVCLFAAGTYAALHELEHAGELPEQGTNAVMFIVFALTSLWYRLISPRRD